MPIFVQQNVDLMRFVQALVNANPITGGRLQAIALIALGQARPPHPHGPIGGKILLEKTKE
jgi:hypothetical protein